MKLIFKNNFKPKNFSTTIKFNKAVIEYEKPKNELAIDDLTKGEGFFSLGNYKAASILFKKTLESNSIKKLNKGQTDKIVSTFIKTADIEGLEKVINDLPPNYTMFTPKLTILCSVGQYNKPELIKWLAEKGLLLKLLKEESEGNSSIPKAIIMQDLTFLNKLKEHLPKNFGKDYLPNKKFSDGLITQVNINESLQRAIKELYDLAGNNDDTLQEAIIVGDNQISERGLDN